MKTQNNVCISNIEFAILSWTDRRLCLPACLSRNLMQGLWKKGLRQYRAWGESFFSHYTFPCFFLHCIVYEKNIFCRKVDMCRLLSVLSSVNLYKKILSQASAWRQEVEKERIHFTVMMNVSTWFPSSHLQQEQQQKQRILRRERRIIIIAATKLTFEQNVIASTHLKCTSTVLCLIKLGRNYYYTTDERGRGCSNSRDLFPLDFLTLTYEQPFKPV